MKVVPSSPDTMSRRSNQRHNADELDFDPPYEVPSSWRWLPLPQLGTLDRGRSRHRPRNDPKLYGGRYPFIQTGDVRAAQGKLTTFTQTYSDAGLAQSRLWPKGTLCITIAANIAETAILGIDACFPDSIVGFLPDENVCNPHFVEFFIRTVKADLAAFAPATAQKNINLETLKVLYVPCPPPAEQDHVIRKLDRLFARSESARKELARLPQLIERYKRAVLAAAFRGDLTAEGRNKSTAKRSAWRETTLNDITEIGTGGTPKRGDPRFYKNGNVPWVTSAAVNKARVDSAEEFITETALTETNCKIFPAGTLLVAMYGEGQTRGRVAVLDIPAATNQALAAIQIRNCLEVCPAFVLWFLRANYLELRKQAAGGVQPNLNLGIIKAIQIFLPSIEEQEEIVRRIEADFTRIDVLLKEAEAALELLDRLDQATLAKAFRGELLCGEK